MPFVSDPVGRTFGDLIQDTRRLLGARYRVRMNKLAAAINDTATTIELAHDLQIADVQSIICVGDELMLVWSTNAASKTLEVERGMFGSTAVSHAANALVEIEPTVSSFDIRNALIDEIRSWPEDLFAVETLDIDWNPSLNGYDLAGVPDDFNRVLEVIHEPLDSSSSWNPVRFWRVVRNMSGDEFSSGTALFVEDPLPSSVASLRVVYGVPYSITTDVSSETLLSSLGLTETMLDIPAYGAAARVLLGREPQRTEIGASPTSRIGEEVPNGAAAGTARTMQSYRDQRLAEERQRLQERYPPRYR